jgi:hypothetical protein
MLIIICLIINFGGIIMILRKLNLIHDKLIDISATTFCERQDINAAINRIEKIKNNS